MIYMPQEDKRHQIIAANELDIRNSDALVLFSDFIGQGQNTAFETGYGAALGKDIYFVGEKGPNTLWHYRPGMLEYSTFGAFLDQLDKIH